MAVQTPKQRIANEKFNKKVEKTRKYGKKKPTKKNSDDKVAISKYWIFALTFLLIGGGVLELLRLFF
ncbi:protein Ysy6p [Monosporozyma servazzii]